MAVDQNLHRVGLGGSDIGAIFGCDPWRDSFSLWCAKKKLLPKDPPNERMLVGKILEPAVLNLYAVKTDRQIEYCDETLRHPDRPWMVYTPDALVKGERRGVDAKCVGWDQRRKWGASSDDIPQHIQLQCWWYLAAMDYEVWDVAAFFGDGFPRVYSIIRDLEAERVMLARAEEWWRRYMEGDETPPIGGSEAASIWLQQAFPHHKRPDLRWASPVEVGWLQEYAQIRVEQNSLKEERAALENRIKLAIGEQEGLIWADGKFTWRKTKDRTKIDWESMARGLLNEYVKDERTREALMGLYTSVTPGPRRTHFDCDLVRDEAEAA